MASQSAREALSRALRVADQSCTAYSILRDKFQRRSSLLELAILLLSTWLTAMVFVQPQVAIDLSPSGISKDLWLGLLSIGTFSLSLVQLQVNWKGRAESFRQGALMLSTFVKECRPLESSRDDVLINQALLKYHLLSDTLIPIPDSQFLKLKQRHKVKVEISKYLDQHPSTNISLLRVKLWWRDNF